MRVLVLNGIGGDGVIALVVRTPDGLRLVGQAEQPGRGAALLPGLLRTMLRAAGWEVASLDLIAAITGPGSFTGLRATLALAHGLALGAGVPLQGVAVAEALRRTLMDGRACDPSCRPPQGWAGSPSSWPIWCVGMARRDRLFVERPDDRGPQAYMVDALPLPGQPVLLAGDASPLVAARIGQAGGIAHISGIERPDPLAVAAIALDRLEGRLPAQAALPLYIDPPEAKRPAAGLRPSPSP